MNMDIKKEFTITYLCNYCNKTTKHLVKPIPEESERPDYFKGDYMIFCSNCGFYRSISKKDYEKQLATKENIDLYSAMKILNKGTELHKSKEYEDRVRTFDETTKTELSKAINKIFSPQSLKTQTILNEFQPKVTIEQHDKPNFKKGFIYILIAIYTYFLNILGYVATLGVAVYFFFILHSIFWALFLGILGVWNGYLGIIGWALLGLFLGITTGNYLLFEIEIVAFVLYCLSPIVLIKTMHKWS